MTEVMAEIISIVSDCEVDQGTKENAYDKIQAALNAYNRIREVCEKYMKGEPERAMNAR